MIKKSLLKIFLACLLLTLFSGCGQGIKVEDSKFPWLRKKGVTRCDDGVVFERVMYSVQHVALKYQKERRLKLEDSNVWYDESLNKIRLDFSSMALLDLCDARFLLVDLVEDLLKSLQNNSELMVALEYPVIHSDIVEVYIDYKCYFGKMVDYDYIGWISLEDNCVNYYGFDMRTDKLDWWQRRSETYPESRAIVKAMREAEKDWRKAHREAPGALEEDRFRFKTDKAPA